MSDKKQTVLMQAIQMIETRIASIPSDEEGGYAHGQYEASTSILDWLKQLLPAEREMIEKTFNNGRRQGAAENSFANSTRVDGTKYFTNTFEDGQ